MEFEASADHGTGDHAFKLEYRPRLTKGETKNAYVGIDFSQRVDEDEQEAPAFSDDMDFA